MKFNRRKSTGGEWELRRSLISGQEQPSRSKS